jgi:hypothetical protein
MFCSRERDKRVRERLNEKLLLHDNLHKIYIHYTYCHENFICSTKYFFLNKKKVNFLFANEILLSLPYNFRPFRVHSHNRSEKKN